MAFEFVLRELDRAIALANQRIVEVAEIKPNWDVLKWERSGPHAMFVEFKKIGAWSEFVSECLIHLQHAKAVCSAMEMEARKTVSYDTRKDNVVKLSAKTWIVAGYAYQEREALLRIEMGEHAVSVAELAQKLTLLDELIGVMQIKARQLAAFRADVRAASQMMNFGNMLGELK